MSEHLRLGTLDDTEAVLELLRLMHGEVGEEAMSEEKVRARIRQCVESGFLCLATEGDKIVGSTGLIFTGFWYSDVIHLADTFFFIHPDHRRSRHAGRLKRYAEALAASMPMKLYWTCIINTQTERKQAFFARHNRLYAQVFVGGAR